MMNDTRDKSDRGDEGMRVRPTDADRGDARKTAPSPASGSDVETGDFEPVPPTERDTSHGIETPGASASDGDTQSLAGSHGTIDTASIEPDGSTDDVTASYHDEGATLSFKLDSRFEDPERTLPPSPEEGTEGTPRVAGHVILGILGEGGMGIVFKARHLRLDRLVALKMIRAGAGTRSQIVERFEAEARAVAGIKHPNIVQIFEIGEHEGQPYFSLEFLGGGNLAKKIGGKPQPVAEAARIVEVLARAIQVAHQHEKKIIHRDLKPANVLLDVDGTLKIADFGLVKELEGESGRTNTGSILGTPSYMAPEQARGESKAVGPAADQYALGAILYELLTGRPPFHGPSAFDTLEMVRNKEPVPPSRLQPKMHRDIETICLKCLEKDPARRYPDVGALAEDLRRFQTGEPIVARPVSNPERLWRWCLRNKRVAALAATVALLLILVVAGSVGAAYTINLKNQALNVANSKAEERRIEAESKQKIAETAQRLAQTAARAAIDQNRSVVDADTNLTGLLLEKLRYVPAIQDVRGQLLDEAIKSLTAAAEGMTNLRRDVGWDPKDEELNWKSVARARQRIGDLYLTQQRIGDAMEQFQHMNSIIEELTATAPPDDLLAQTRLARSQRQLGFVAFQYLADTDAALRYFRRALEINRACLARKNDDDRKLEVANTLGQIAAVELLLGHLERAREIYREEESIRESFSPARARHFQMRMELASLYERIAELQLRMGNKEQGRQSYDLCRLLREEVLAERPGLWPAGYARARSFNNSGFLCYPHGDDPKAARVFHRQALDLIEKRALADPLNLETKSMLAETLYYEATCALHSGDKAGADAGYRRCLEIRKLLASEPTAKLPQVSLMVALARCGEHAEAAKIAKTLVATPPKDEQFYFQAACGYALAAGACGDAALARHYTEEAVACLREGKKRGWADVVSLQIDPDLEPIRNDPAFRELLAQFPRPGEKRP